VCFVFVCVCVGVCVCRVSRLQACGLLLVIMPSV